MILFNWHHNKQLKGLWATDLWRCLIVALRDFEILIDLKNNIFEMFASVFHIQTELVWTNFHNSANHIPWNWADFVGDSNFQFIWGVSSVSSKHLFQNRQWTMRGVGYNTILLELCRYLPGLDLAIIRPILSVELIHSIMLAYQTEVIVTTTFWGWAVYFLPSFSVKLNNMKKKKWVRTGWVIWSQKVSISKIKEKLYNVRTLPPLSYP